MTARTLITVWRHGEAAPGSPDRDRPLTPRGRSDLDLGARAFSWWLQRSSLPAPDRLLCSRWRRTAQTAGILAGRWGVPVEEHDCLIPGARAEGVEQAADALMPFEHCVLVSHQPLVSQLVDRWIGDGRVPSLVPGAFATVDLGALPGLAPAALTLAGWAAPPGYDPCVA